MMYRIVKDLKYLSGKKLILKTICHEWIFEKLAVWNEKYLNIIIKCDFR